MHLLTEGRAPDFHYGRPRTPYIPNTEDDITSSGYLSAQRLSS